MSDTKSLELRKFLPYRLVVLSNKIGNEIAESYESKFNLSIPEWRVIAILARHPKISAQDLGKKAAMDKVAVSRAVKNLLLENRIVRVFSDNDKRQSILSLSKQGGDIYKQVVPEARKYEDQLKSKLTEKELENLDIILEKLM